MPTHLQVPAIGVNAVVESYTIAQAQAGVDGVTGKPCYVDGFITCIDPPSKDIVSMQVGGVGGVVNGAMPATHAAGTVYLYGHAVTYGKGVFQDLSTLTAGEQATITTEAGTLQYVVQQVVRIPKRQFRCPDATHPADQFTPIICDQVSGRLLLVSCDHQAGAQLVNGGYATDNTVAILQLVN